ncbi:Crp/Fnr family transcriptional regulator [Variovorax ureilyticus]|uniref:Crp/Fnr family transcriptional regulator n=1 Tax=Variovorax ureilyticus TaxID=1836198 RepID=UPI003D671096
MESWTKQELLEQQCWWPVISAAARQRVLEESSEESVPAGSYLSHYGEECHYWYGILEGLLKWSINTADGQTSTLGGQLAGSWFGEATLLRGLARKSDLVALRFSRVLLVPAHTFHELRRTETAFNEFLLSFLAERIHWMMANAAAQRLLDPDRLMARALVGITHPILNNHAFADDGNAFFLAISQEELSHLVAFSRQRCSRALATLQARGLVRMEYGGVSIIDLQGLKSFTDVCDI